MDKYCEYDTEMLGLFYSDFYKDCHGIRPNGIDWSDREQIIRGIEKCHQYLEQMKQTQEGRMQLVEDGWVI